MTEPLTENNLRPEGQPTDNGARRLGCFMRLFVLLPVLLLVKIASRLWNRYVIKHGGTLDSEGNLSMPENMSEKEMIAAAPRPVLFILKLSMSATLFMVKLFERRLPRSRVGDRHDAAKNTPSSLSGGA